MNPVAPGAQTGRRQSHSGRFTLNDRHLQDDDIIEVIPHTKPTPELVSLDESDDENHNRNESSSEQDIDKYIKDTLLKHSKQYPTTPIASVADVTLLCDELIAEFAVKGVQPLPRGSRDTKYKVARYYNHVMKNQELLCQCAAKIQIDSLTSACAEAAWKRWAARTQFNAQIENCISKKLTEEEYASWTHPKERWSQVLPYLIDGKTRLQSVLTPNFSRPPKTASLMNTDLMWDECWSPLRDSMPFELFIKTISILTPDFVPQRPIAKKWYIKYLHAATALNRNFLLGVVSAFGTDLRFYPAKILSLFQSRGMLRDECKLIEGQTGLVETDDCEVEFICVTVKEATPQQQQQTPQTTEAEVIPIPRAAQTPEQPYLQRVFNLSFERFKSVIDKMWMDYYEQGRVMIASEEMLMNMYQKLSSLKALESHLRQAFTHLYTECQQYHPDSFPVPKKLTAFEITRWKQIITAHGPVIQRRPTCPQILMESGTSLLQLSLLKDEVSLTKIPAPHEWEPIRCILPCDLFKALCYSYLTAEEKITAELDLGEEALKVRYVELMFDCFGSSPRDVLRAVFTAMGPDLNDLPLRIVYILQQTGLLRNDLGLPQLQTAGAHDIYQPLDQNFRKRRRCQTHHDHTAAQGSDSTEPNMGDCAVSSSSFVSESVQEYNWPEESPALTEEEWSRLTTSALQRVGLSTLTSAGCQSTLEELRQHGGTEFDHTNPAFLEGIVAGVVVARKFHNEQQIPPQRPSVIRGPTPIVGQSRVRLLAPRGIRYQSTAYQYVAAPPIGFQPQLRPLRFPRTWHPGNVRPIRYRPYEQLHHPGFTRF